MIISIDSEKALENIQHPFISVANFGQKKHSPTKSMKHVKNSESASHCMDISTNIHSQFKMSIHTISFRLLKMAGINIKNRQYQWNRANMPKTKHGFKVN